MLEKELRMKRLLFPLIGHLQERTTGSDRCSHQVEYLIIILMYNLLNDPGLASIMQRSSQRN